MPWQCQVIEVATEYDPANDVPFYRELVVTVPRQSGKTILLLVWMLHRALMVGRPQSIAYTAQSGNDARMKLIDDHYDKLLSRSDLASTIKKAKRAMGATAIVFQNGSRIDALATSAEAGHGKTLDLAVIDEAMADADDRREQALLPTMATRADAQLLVFSTAGTEASVLLRRKVDAGRAHVSSDRRSGIAYFEWSAEKEDNPDDRSVWWRVMPALGHEITEATVEHARATMSDGDFRRAYLNQWVSSDERVIPPDVWQSNVSPDASPSGRLVFGVDAPLDQSTASIVAVDGNLVCELVDRRDHPAQWLKPRIVELAKTHGGSVAIDGAGPIGHLADALESEGVEVFRYTPRAMAHACGFAFSQIADGLIEVRDHPALTEAVEGAVQLSMGDAWRWGRKSASSDVSPLVALTMALGRQSSTTSPKELMIGWA